MFRAENQKIFGGLNASLNSIEIYMSQSYVKNFMAIEPSVRE